MSDEKTYSVEEVAHWQENGIVDVPAMQRGLVWEPHQVELLWDSILRGFPIGAFVLTPVSGNESQQTRDCGCNSQYFLLDGQQRYNAIKVAFGKRDNDVDAVLWLDFMPPSRVNSTRKFWAKVITKAHPWGFANNDSCSVLGWSTYREALNSFDSCNEEMRVQDVPMSKAWPFKARCPIPFAEVFDMFKKVGGGTESDFCDAVVAWCSAHESIGCESKDYGLIKGTAKDVFVALKRLCNYRVIATFLNPEMLEDQRGIEDDILAEDGTNTLEQLFTRINTLGTPISPYDLRYSAIKAYWGDIKNANDKIAATIMPAAHLAILSFRLAMTLAKDNGIFGETPSVERIRSLKAKNDDESRTTCRIVRELYCDDGNRLHNIIQTVERALRVYKNDGDAVDGLPAVIRTSIVLNSPDVYLLLLYMAYKGTINNFGNIVGLATWLHWFSAGKQKTIVDDIKEVVDIGDEEALRKRLHGLCNSGEVVQPVKPADNNFFSPCRFLKADGTICDWASFETEKWYPLFDRIWSQKELVIFATRRCFNMEFRYDPAETKFLTGHNRPWDMDHIVPKSWVSRQGVSMGEWQKTCLEWVWSNGNFAPIPFTLNRIKGDRPNWGYYEKNKAALFFDDNVVHLQSDKMTKDKDMAMRFIHTTHRRMISMYEEWRKEIAAFFGE